MISMSEFSRKFEKTAFETCDSWYNTEDTAAVP